MSVVQKVNHYLSLVKFSHTIFALPFALIGFVLGGQDGWLFDSLLGRGFSIKEWLFVVGALLLKVILCMVFARNAAMGFNRYLDADIDAKNKRTATRDVPAGRISKRNALLFVLINCLLFVVTTYFINSICFYLSPVALFVILIYSYTKRFTALCHLVLGVGLSLAPIGAYLAVTGEFDSLVVLFSAIVFTWVSAFDILYALQDEGFDSTYNLHSIPVLLGRYKSMWVSRILHCITAILIICAGLLGEFHFLYWIGALLFIALLVYQHSLIKLNDISKIDLAFGTTNGVASVVFAFFLILDIVYLYYSEGLLF